MLDIEILPIYINLSDKTPDKFISLNQLTNMAQNPRIGAKLQSKLLTPYKANDKTKKTALESLYYIVVVDHDHDNLSYKDIKEVYDLYNIAYLAYTTSRHKQEKLGNRWKVIIPLLSPVEYNIWIKYAAGATLKVKGDPVQFRAQQVFFVPNKITDNSPYEFIIEIDKPFLNLSDNKHSFVIDCLNFYTQEETKKEQKETFAQPKIYTGSNGTIIEKVNQYFSLAVVLTERGYIKKGTRFLSPNSQSGIPGVSMLPENRCYSHHGAADPLSNLNNDGKSLDCFDVLCILDYGGSVKKAIKSLANKVDPEGQKNRQTEYMQEKKSKLERPINIQIIERKDIEQDDDESLKISKLILNPGGLISEGMEALNTLDTPNIPQYNFPLIISLIARALVGKISYSNVWPNFYHVKIGGTGTGKTDSDSRIREAMENFDFKEFFGPDDFSSGPALLKALQNNSQCIINLDEISYLFKRIGKNDPITAGKIEVLLQLYTRCGRSYSKPYADFKKNIIILKPCLIIIGNTTTDIFDNILPEDFTSGLIQRFTFWHYAGKMLHRKPTSNNINQKLDNFLKELLKIFLYESSNSTLAEVMNSTVKLDIDNSGYNRLNDFSRFVIDTANRENNEGKVGIISRKYYECIKYALVHWASKNFDFVRPLQLDDIDYGINVANLVGDWKLNVLFEKIKTGDFHKICDIFKQGIALVIKNKKKPTGKMIADRKRIIKNLKPHEFRDVVQSLAGRKEIFIDESGPSTQYFLTKDLTD